MTCRSVAHLIREHEQIEEVLAAFENFLLLEESSDGPDRHELWDVVDCLSESLLIRHEEKEESILLPELTRYGFSWTDGTLAHVRQEHRHGRYLLRCLRYAVHQTRDWSPENLRHFMSIGHEWVGFIRHHMGQEERLLFTYLDSELSPAQDDRLLSEYESVDRGFDEMPDAQRLHDAKAVFLAKYTRIPYKSAGAG